MWTVPPGKRRGSALLRAIHGHADSDGWLTARFTVQRRNFLFYAERYGYELVAARPERIAGLDYRCFCRTPRPPRA